MSILVKHEEGEYQIVCGNMRMEALLKVKGRDDAVIVGTGDKVVITRDGCGKLISETTKETTREQ